VSQARQRVKKQITQCGEGQTTLKRILNGKQLAIKVSCNSIYGFCGAVQGGLLPCVPIAGFLLSHFSNPYFS
jgi:DNA polymerase delta subunit 1